MGDKRTYEQVIALRAVQSEDFMTADWFVFPAPVLKKISSRITNEVAGINRVTYDISSKPPAVSATSPCEQGMELIRRADCRVALDCIFRYSALCIENVFFRVASGSPVQITRV